MPPLANTKSCLLVVAAILFLRADAAHAQPSSGTVRERTYANPEASTREPRWGFATGMRPGPGNAYTHPYVWLVVPGSAAETAGLMVGDTILSIDGRDIRYGPFFLVEVPGTRYVMLVRRGTEELELTYIFPAAKDTPPAERPAAAPPE